MWYVFLNWWLACVLMECAKPSLWHVHTHTVNCVHLLHFDTTATFVDSTWVYCFRWTPDIKTDMVLYS